MPPVEPCPERSAPIATWSPDATPGAALRTGRNDLIEQSHQRCSALGLTRIERPDYEPLMRSDLAVARERKEADVISQIRRGARTLEVYGF